MKAGENLLPIPGHGGYFVSDAGIVYSSRRCDRLGFRDGDLRPLKGVPNPRNRYLSVALPRSEAGKSKQRMVYVHHLVAAAFLGQRPEAAEEIRHLDGDCQNNASKNLAWGTIAENQADSFRHGTKPFGDRHLSSKLRAAQVAEIKRSLARGSGHTDLARRYGVTEGTIRFIKSGKTWKQVDVNENTETR